MSAISVSSSPDCALDQAPIAKFFDCLRARGHGTLLLDYDGTLAPFTERRERARPYVQVPYLLDGIMRQTRSRVIIVSGRPAESVAGLLSTSLAPEIWGSHGVERILPCGTAERLDMPAEDLQALKQALAALIRAGLREWMEIKSGSVAVHWRGLSADAQAKLWRRTAAVMRPFTESSSLSMIAFEAGLELRIPAANKGHAVRSALRECDASAAAYLGDDLTDEDAFQALNQLGGLTVLARAKHRDTAATAWLPSPAQLFAFLADWLAACRGERL
jgi:trehalose-phosphatase